jgi:hypothetical protein
MRLDRDNVLGLFVTGSIHEIGDEAVGGLLTLVEYLSSSLERRNRVTHVLARFVFLDNRV